MKSGYSRGIQELSFQIDRRPRCTPPDGSRVSGTGFGLLHTDEPKYQVLSVASKCAVTICTFETHMTVDEHLNLNLNLSLNLDSRHRMRKCVKSSRPTRFPSASSTGRPFLPDGTIIHSSRRVAVDLNSSYIQVFDMDSNRVKLYSTKFKKIQVTPKDITTFKLCPIRFKCRFKLHSRFNRHYNKITHKRLIGKLIV